MSLRREPGLGGAVGLVALAALFGRRHPTSGAPPYPDLVDLVAGALLVLDERRAVVYVGGGAVALFGGDRGPIVGRPFEELVDPASASGLAGLLAAARPDPPWPEAELRGAASGGRPGVPWRVVARRLGPGYGLFVQDLTEREELVRAIAQRAAELSRSNRDLEQFAYVASHDLQEPLRMVGSYTELLRERYQDRLDADGIEFLRFAHDGVLRMRELIEALLAFARVGSRARPFEPVALDAVAERVLANLAEAIRRTGADVRFDPLPSVEGDRVQLVQLIQNLVGNALKFTKGGPPRVRVSASRTGAEWVITVQDHGIGIAPEFQEKVFQIFQRLHTREEYPGSGIGLSICRRVVERHGGRIWIESTGQPGEGSAFRFTLPAPGAAPPTPPPAAVPTPREAALADRAQRLIEDRLRELI